MMSKFLQFPKGFFWGAASASYQVEGNIYNNDWAYDESSDTVSLLSTDCKSSISFKFSLSITIL